MTHTIVAVNDTSTEILAENSHRIFLLIQNDSNQDIYVSLNGSPAELNKGIRLNAGGGSLLLDSNIEPGVIYAIHGGTGTKNVLISLQE